MRKLHPVWHSVYFNQFKTGQAMNSSSDDENHILNDAMANTEQYNALGDDRLNVLDIDSN